MPERALIVDEQPGARHALRDVVVEMGIRQVDTARDPLHALELIENDPYPLILSECELPRLGLGQPASRGGSYPPTAAGPCGFRARGLGSQRSLVATTSEWQPDALLIKPIVHAVVAPRIEQALGQRRPLPWAQVAIAQVTHIQGRNDGAAATVVQDCLRAAERLIPGGSGRMFKGLLVNLDPPDEA